MSSADRKYNNEIINKVLRIDHCKVSQLYASAPLFCSVAN